MATTKKNIPSTIKAKLSVKPDQLRKAMDSVKKREVKNITIKGFRKGKAPFEIAEKLLDPDKIIQSAFSQIIPNLLEDELLKEKEQSGRSRIILVDEPHYHVEEMDASLTKDIIVEAAVSLYPEVYTGHILEELTITKPLPETVTEEKVQEFIDHLKSNFSKIAEKNQKEATDEELLRILKADTMDQLQERTRKELEEEAIYQVEQKFEQELINALVAASDIDVPEPLIKREISRIVDAMYKQLQKLGATIDSYLESQGKTQEEWQNDLVKQATDNVKSMLILTELTQDMNIELSSEEISEIAKSGTKEQQDTYALMLRQRKALDLLKTKVTNR